MKEYKSIKITTTRIICAIILILIISLICYIIYKNMLVNKFSNYSIYYRQKYETNNHISEKESYSKIKSYTVNIVLEPKHEKEYKMGEDFLISVKIESIDDNLVNYCFRINKSEYVHFDTIHINNIDELLPITIYQIGNYYAFENTGKVDSMDTHIYIFNKFGDLYKDLYKNGIIKENEMYIENFKFTRNELIINTSRLINNFQVLYNGKIYEVKEEGSNDLPNNLALKIQYKYVVDENGNVDFFNPETKVLKTLQN